MNILSTKNMVVFSVVFILSAGCSSSDISDMSDKDTFIQSAIALYSPLLDAEKPQQCISNCRHSIRGTEWRLTEYRDVDEKEIAVTNQSLFTLLISEIDNRVIGLFACNALNAGYTAQDDRDLREFVTINDVAIGSRDCQLKGLAADEYRFAAEFLTSGNIDAETNSDSMKLVNARGQQLLYTGRADALDGEYRTFRTIYSGDYLLFDKVGVGANSQSTEMNVYTSQSEIEITRPELNEQINLSIMPLDFITQTVVGLYVMPVSYLGPDIWIEHVIERENNIEVVVRSGEFICNDGAGQPKGDNAPYRLSALKAFGKPVDFVSRPITGCF